MEKKIILAIVIILIISVAGVGTWMIVDNQKKTNKNVSESENEVTEHKKNDVEESIKEEAIVTDEKTNDDTDLNTSTQISLNGTYSNKSETSSYYYSASVVVTNQTNSSIDFELSAVNGADIDHVNIGQVSGTAKKIKTDIYQYEETISGKTYKITFEFSAYRAFQYVTINESYPDNINPYAGNNVYFEGEYEKIS